MQWNSLQSYFLSDFDLNDDPIWSDPDEKPSREEVGKCIQTIC